MERAPEHGHEALRRGRWSVSGAEYFLTLCTPERKPGLNEPAMQLSVLAEMRRLEADGAWHLRSADIMPDHVHLLVSIGAPIDLASAVRLFKGRPNPALRKRGLRRQMAYFDHRMRRDED